MLYVDKRKAAWKRRIDRGRDHCDMFLDHAPVVRTQNKHSDPTACQSLLVTEFLIRGDEQVRLLQPQPAAPRS